MSGVLDRLKYRVFFSA